MGILSPRGEGEYYDLLYRTFLMMVFTNIPLALWGEGVRRTGEGLFPLPEPQFTQSMVSHESGFIHITVDASQSPLTRVLPQGNVTTIGKYRLLLSILGNHDKIPVKLLPKILVIEIRTSIDERLLLIYMLHQFKELEQRIAEFSRIKSGCCLHVNHRDEILLLWSALREEIQQLLFLISLRTIEMIGPDLYPMLTGHLYVLFIPAVYSVATLRSLDIDVCHLCATNSIPEHPMLIVRDVYSMDMLTGILTLHILRTRRK